MEKQKNENDQLLQQGNMKYTNEEDVKLHIAEKLGNLDMFYFDWKIPAEKRLIDFKANVVNRGIKLPKDRDLAGEAF